MPLATIPPPRRPDLILRPSGNEGRMVVKDARTGAYFTMEAQEGFLLEQLDGQRSVEDICAAFEHRFGEALNADDLEGFLDVAAQQKLLQAPGEAVPAEPNPLASGADSGAPATPPQPSKSTFGTGNWLFWRKSFMDPDRLFNRLEPKIRFIWTKAFLFTTLTGILWAWFLLGMNFREYLENFAFAFNLETLALAYLAIGLCTLCHEFAHGLTCKHYGGEVHDIGFLLMFFMPCFYCNVSDAWLFKEKSKRLLVTLAGGYCDMVMWALAILMWRFTLPGTMPYHLAWIVLSVCGARVFFNFFPLFKLDGYYLLSDAVEIPNLRQRSLDYLAAHVRWLLWGAERPERDASGRTLMVFGLLCFAFGLFYLCLMLWGMLYLAIHALGPLGLIPVSLLAWLLVPPMFQGFSRGEVTTMFLKRHKRLAIWGGILISVIAILILVPAPDRASGNFKVRPAVRAEIRAPITGFLQIVNLDEGDRVSSGTHVASLEIPELPSRVAQKAAEVREAEAKLRLLEAGARKEEIVEQRHRVTRAKGWRDLANQDLDRRKNAMGEELTRLEKQAGQAKTRYEFASEALERGKKLMERRALALDAYNDLEKEYQLSQSGLAQAVAARRERVALGTLDQENELAKREKELADAEATLKLLEAGTRLEEIQAERARLARLTEERNYLEKTQERLRLTSPIGGLIVTPRLKEKIGHYFKEGDLIFEIEEPGSLEAELPLDEQEVASIKPGQEVVFKARALPWTSFTGTVDRIAPMAANPTPNGPSRVQNTLTVVVKLNDPPADLRSGMTGYARIYCGSTSLGGYLFSRIYRYIRTEYWW